MLQQYQLNAGAIPQEFSLPGGMDGEQLITISWGSSPSSGTVTVETRRIGYESWDIVAASVAATSDPEALEIQSAGSINGVRITFAGLAGPSSPVLWVSQLPLRSASTSQAIAHLIGLISDDSGEFPAPAALHRFKDPNDRVYAYFDPSGLLRAKLGLQAAAGSNLSLAFDPITMLTTIDLEDMPSAEVTAARGTTASLSDRLASIRLDGLPSAPLYGAQHLRETRRLLSALRSGAVDTVLSVCAVGDSWTDNRLHWIERLRAQLLSEYGSAGTGFVAPGRGAADGAVTITYSGFSALNFVSPSPHLLELESSTAGHSVTVTAPGGADEALLYYRGDTGIVRARYNAGAWSADIPLSGTGTQTVALPTPPAGAITLEIEVVSGTCVIYGVELRDTAPGIRWHKLGAGNSRAAQWAAVDAQQWQDGIAALAPRLVTLMLGTNDRHWYDEVSFSGYMQTMIDRVRAAAPLADILLISPPENLSAGPRDLEDYSYITRQLAAANRCAHLDLQPYFGDPTDPLGSYGDNGAGYILLSDASHPSSVGDFALTEAIYRAILWS